MLLVLALLQAAVAAEPRHISVDEALALLEQSPRIEAADAAVAQARAASLGALSAVLPSLSGAGSYTRNNAAVELALGDLFTALAALTGQQPTGDMPDTIVLQPLDAVSGSATLRVPIVAPSAWASISAARSTAQAAEAASDATRSNLRGAALQAFWAGAAAEATADALTASAERARELAASAERLLQAGVSTRLSLLSAQTELARREGDLVSARAALEKARIAAGVALGLDEPVVVELSPPSAGGAADADADALVEGALGRRPELRAVQAQADAARAQLLSARLGIVPALSGSFSAFASNVAYSTGEKTGWRASVDLSWPLLAGGSRVASARRASGQLAEANANLEATRLQVSQQVRSALADVGVAGHRLELARQQVALAEEAARVAQRSFEQGTLDTAGVLDALDRLDRARASEIDALARAGMAEAALRTATGEW